MVKNEIAKYNGWDVNTMFAIAQAENRSCDPKVKNLSNTENHGVCIGSYGVLQVGCLHYQASDDKDDLHTNVQIAYNVWSNRQKYDSGYNAWSTYKNGSYKQFIK